MYLSQYDKPSVTASVQADAYGHGPTAGVTQQEAAAQASRYQDIYANVQAAREAAYAKEAGRGQFSKEFSGLGELAGLGKPLGILVVLLALGGGAYFMFLRKKKVAARKRRK